MNDLTAYDKKLLAARKELQTAGPIHRRDLLRQIRRLQRKRRMLVKLQEPELAEGTGNVYDITTCP